MMKLAALSALVASASAFAPAQTGKATVALNAFEDENWGNEKRKQAGGLNQPNQRHRKRAPKKGVSMLKTEIQKALLGDDEEDD